MRTGLGVFFEGEGGHRKGGAQELRTLREHIVDVGFGVAYL